MNPQLIGPALAVVGFAVNALWSWFNLRWEKRTLEHIDDLKSWMRERYYDRDFLDERQNVLVKRLEKAGV